MASYCTALETSEQFCPRDSWVLSARSRTSKHITRHRVLRQQTGKQGMINGARNGKGMRQTDSCWVQLRLPSSMAGNYSDVGSTLARLRVRFTKGCCRGLSFFCPFCSLGILESAILSDSKLHKTASLSMLHRGSARPHTCSQSWPLQNVSCFCCVQGGGHNLSLRNLKRQAMNIFENSIEK